MISISVKSNLSRLGDLAKQFPTATVNALNRTAFEIRKAEQQEMKAVFDQPTPWIIKSVYTKQATLENPVATVVPSDYLGNSEKVLLPHVEGGTRLQKRFEARLSRTGLLPAGWVSVPAKGVPLDTYGNFMLKELTAMLSWIGALDMGNRNKLNTRKNKAQRNKYSYFLIYPGRGPRGFPPGIYKRSGGIATLMLLFVQKASYKKRLGWNEVAGRIVNDTLEKKFRSEIYAILGGKEYV